MPTVDQWLRTVVDGQPADPTARYIMRIDPHLYTHLQHAAAAAAVAASLRDDLPPRPALYGQSAIITDPQLPAGGWQLRTADGTTILRDGVLHLPAAGFR